MCFSGNYTIWCLLDKYEELFVRVYPKNSPQFINENKLESRPYQPIHGQYKKENYQSYGLEQLPYLWGMYDKKEAFSNSIVNHAINKNQNQKYDLDLSNAQVYKRNYLLIKADAQQTGTMTVHLGTTKNNLFTSSNSFKFNLIKGENIRYLIR